LEIVAPTPPVPGAGGQGSRGERDPLDTIKLIGSQSENQQQLTWVIYSG